jgi:hypothetical protein
MKKSIFQPLKEHERAILLELGTPTINIHHPFLSGLRAKGISPKRGLFSGLEILKYLNLCRDTNRVRVYVQCIAGWH